MNGSEDLKRHLGQDTPKSVGMPRPVVALLSDFGSRDHYAGTMKGVILSICPDVALVDISHDIPPHDIQRAALELGGAYRYFPDGTVFLAVVDPGVGSRRRALAAGTGRYRFVGPDNGVLSLVLEECPPTQVVEISERQYTRETVSRTFEGRDRFAPAAGWLAAGLELGALGSIVTDYVRCEFPVPLMHTNGVEGAVVRIDRFGNLITNITRAQLRRTDAHQGVEIHVGGYRVSRLVETYADIAQDEVCALFDSNEYLEIAAFSTSASDRLAVTVGAAVRVDRQ